MHKFIAISAALSLIGANVALMAGHASEPAGNVILIGWDGAGRDNIKRFMEADELPTLSRVASSGRLVAIDILRTTDTKSGWTQILTGYEPERTGVFNNWRYGPIPKGYSVFERLESRLGPENIVTVAVIGKRTHVDADPPMRKPLKGATKPKKPKDQNENITVVSENGKSVELIPGRPWYHASRSVDVFENGFKKDWKVAARAMELLETYRDERFFFFIHFAEIDTTGHHHGEGSKKHHDAYLSADHWTGEILDRLAELGIDDRTTVYITADHGFDVGQKQHKDAPYVWLATNNKDVSRRGERADIAPTILESFGLDPASFDPPLDGHALTKAHELPIW